MSNAAGFKTIHVKNMLGEKLHRPGGIGRKEAVEAATVGVESLRKDYVKAIPGEIAALEEIVSANRFGHVSAGDIQQLLDRAGYLLTLSGTFGCTRLDTVVKRFCDLGIGMLEKGITSVAPIEVHLRTMWLVAPDSPALSDDEAANLLNELAKIHLYYGFKCAQPDAEASNED